MGFIGNTCLGRKIARVVAIALVFQAVPLRVVPVQAQEAGFVNPAFTPTLPIAYDMAKVAGQGMLFQGCTQGLQQTMSQSLENLGKLAGGASGSSMAASPIGFGINTVCPASDVGPDADSLSCQTLAPTGVINQDVVRAKAQALDLALASIDCRRGKFNAIKAELSCLTSQADMLSQQLASIQGAYQANIQKYQKEASQIDSVIADRTYQQQEVLSRLGGSGGENGNGSTGLLAVKKALTEALGKVGDSGIPYQIRVLENKMKDVSLQQKALDEAIVQRQMGLTGECFNGRKEGGFRCEPNGELLDAKSFVLCRYERNLNLTGNGQLEQSTIVAAQAAAKKEGLANLLDQILGEMPQRMAPSAPGQPPSMDPSAPAATLLTVADIENQYGAQLAQYDFGEVRIRPKA